MQLFTDFRFPVVGSRRQRPRHVERIGMGIQKMKEAMVAAGLREPTFEPNGFFRATFHRSPEFAMKSGADATTEGPEGLAERVAERVAERLPEGLAESQKMILQLVRRNPQVSRKAMAEEIGISTTAIHRNLVRLKEKGILRRVGPARGGYWEVMSFADAETEGPEGLAERVADGVADGLAERVAESQEKILQLVRRNPQVSRKAMAEEIGVSTTAIHRNLAKLKEKGLLRRVGPARGGHWEVVSLIDTASQSHEGLGEG